MLTGSRAYSTKFYALEQERLTRIKDGGLEHAQQLAARERARKLSLETNRRRKALETKKKLEAQKEAKRRHEVLEERRQRQREATIKYQRLNKGNKRHVEQNTAQAYPGAPLQDGILLAHGYRVDSPGSHGTSTPSLDDVLQMVGAPSTLSLKYGQGQVSCRPNGVAPSHTYPTTSQYGGSYTDGNADITAGIETKGYAKPTHGALTSAVPHSRVDSRSSQFEQELAAQQNQLIAQQQQSLLEFNQVIQTETRGESGRENLQRSSSLSSVDSLEDQPKQNNHNQKHREASNRLDSVDDTAHQTYKQFEPHNLQTATPGDDRTVNYANFGTPVSSGIGAYSYGTNGVTGHSGVSDYCATSAPPQTSGGYSLTSQTNTQHYSMYHNDQVVSGGTNVTAHFPNDAVTKAPHHTGYNSEVEYRPTKDDAKNEGNSTSQAWSASKPDTTQLQQHSSNSTANLGQRSRPYSARTTATAVTITPAVSYPSRTPDSQVPHNGGADKLQSRATNQTGVGVQQMKKTPHPSKPSKAKDQGITVSPKSILKRHRHNPATQELKMTGVAAAIVKDSLEIGKKSGLKSPKKGVRWTDMRYSDDESVATEETLESAISARKPKLVSSVNARTVQEHLGDGSEHSNKSTPSRPKSGRPSSAKGSGGRSENPCFPQGTIIKHNQNRKEREDEKPTHVVQNGIRLDKTPTDDEINWLWDKVRTCLNTRDETNGGDTHNAVQSNNSRQTSASNQFAEQRITANLRVAPPANKPRFGTHRDSIRKQGSAPRWRTNGDSGSHLRRATLLHQRRPHISSAGTTRNSSQPMPASSQQGPSRSLLTSQQPYDQEVTDSLMAFQQAEQLVQQNAEDAEIVSVIEQQRQHPLHEQKAHPSALSMEEQKILESLDRLNARLKTVTAEVTGAFNPVYPMMPPRPPSYGVGFRGHRPISSRPGLNGVGPSHRARTHSADRSSVRTGHRR